MATPVKPLVYLDYAASAPVRRIAEEAEAAYREEPFSGANPNSLHTMGREAARVLGEARTSLARVLGGGFRPLDVAFSGGGTEANNLCVLGLAEGRRRQARTRRRVVISAIEHDSVLDLAPELKARGFEVSLVRPDAQGVVGASQLERELDDDVALACVMAANNETGACQPVRALARAAHEKGALFLTDAIQAFCHVPLELSEVDAVTLAAHKIGALPGVGAFAVRHGVPFKANSFGGGQEMGRRAGTQDVAGAIAFAKCAETLAPQVEAAARTTSELAQWLTERLTSIPRVKATTALPYDGASRLPGIVNVMVDGAESETLILALDDAGFEVSAGSACSSGSLDPSHVLTAMGIPRDLALGALRISFDERVGKPELEAFMAAFGRIVCPEGAR